MNWNQDWDKKYLDSMAEQVEIKGLGKVRVNEVEIENFHVRRSMDNGHPSGPWELLGEIPGLGFIEFEDKPDFVIEVKHPRKRQWERISLTTLLDLLGKSLGIELNKK